LLPDTCFLKQDLSIGAFMHKHVDLFAFHVCISLNIMHHSQIRLISFAPAPQTAMIKAEGHFLTVEPAETRSNALWSGVGSHARPRNTYCFLD
jgi:hypothetical protein